MNQTLHKIMIETMLEILSFPLLKKGGLTHHQGFLTHQILLRLEMIHMKCFSKKNTTI